MGSGAQSNGHDGPAAEALPPLASPPAGPPQGKGRQNGSEAQEDHLTVKSKEMANHLRHDPPGGMDGFGFVPVPSLVAKMQQDTSPEEVVRIVERDDKGRYQLMVDGSGQRRVRAVQGHSVHLPNPMHDPIRAPEEVPMALHATSKENWQKIQESGALRRMSRQHVHFASEPKHLRADDWACVLLQVDLRRAIEAGISFCRAANGVVLSEGPIPLEFVRPIKLHDLPEDWQREIPNRERLLQQEDEEEQGQQ